MAAPILLDVSRLLARARFGAPSGIDRVEHAYAEHLLALAPDRLHFVAMDRLGRLCRLPHGATHRFVAGLGRHWASGSPQVEQLRGQATQLWMRALLPRLPRAARAAGRPFYLIVSHRHLHRRARIEAALAGANARLAVFVHDLIPIEYPEYARPMQREKHLLRIRTTAALADAVIVNSQVTAEGLRPYLTEAGRAPPVLVAPLGLGERWASAPVPPSPPYFVFVSTIEPRKNHLLLLQIWRMLAARHGAAAPRLVIVGRRGWENENVVDFLDRAPSIHPLVREHAAMTDAAIGTLLHGARALLFPSFAEGFGLPVAEALACGVPVICSDLGALREVAGDVPDYLDPLDGLGWLAAIEAYSAADSPQRAAQMQRLQGWRPPQWPQHLADMLALLDAIA